MEKEMNLRPIWYGIFALALLFACGAALAEETTADEGAGVSTSLDLAYVSKYVWRGMVVNDDPALQPSLTFAHSNGLSLNFWGSLDTTDIAGEKGNITEVDYTLDYEWAIKKTGLNAGVSYFTYPHIGAEATGEAYVKACFGGDWSPSLGVNYDFKEIKGTYLSLGLSRDCNLTPGKEKNPRLLGLSAQLGYGTATYNSGYFEVDKATFNDVLLSASLPCEVNDKLTVTPSISYAALLDNDLKQATRDIGNDTSVLFGGVTFSYAF
jgi:uncharacterized protein (TIGR02001 family)